MTTKNAVSTKPVSSPVTSPPVSGTITAETTGITTAPRGFQANIQQMLQGVQTVLPTGGTLSSAAGTVTQATMVSQLQTMLQAYQAVANDEVDLQESRGQLKAQVPTYHLQYTTMKNLLIGFFGAGSPQLTKFGIKAKGKSRTLSAAKLVERQARSAQTRLIRNTMGSQQKKDKVFTGTVQVSTTATGVSSTPASPAAPTPAPVSAPVAVPVSVPTAPVTTQVPLVTK